MEHEIFTRKEDLFRFEREKYSFDANSLAKIKEEIIPLVLVDVCLFWSLNSY